MATQNRSDLKKYFETGDTPTSKDFADLIDSFLNKQEDDIHVDQSKMGLGVKNPINKLDVSGSVSIGSNLAGKTQAPVNGLFVEGNLSVGAEKTDERLTVDGALSFKLQEGSPSPTTGFGKLFVKKEKITSILFNGSDNFIEIGQTNEKLKDLKTGTLSMWYKPADSEPRTQQLIWRGSTHSFQIGTGHWVDGYDDESMTVGIYRGGQPELEFYVRRGHNFFTNNQWYHIAFVVGENFNKLFIDGVEQNVTYTQGNAQTGNIFLDREEGVDDTIYLGKRVKEESPPLFTSGYLDEICIIDYTLSNWDVKKLYDNGRKTDLRLEYRQNLVAFWRISETQTLPTIEDFSGNDLHGIFKGTPDENTLQSKEVNTLYFKDGDGNELPLSGTSDAGSVRSLWGQKGSNIYFQDGNIGVGTSDPKADLHVEGQLLGAAMDTSNRSLRVCSGKTDIGNTNWEVFGSAVSLYVDLSACGFTEIPYLVSSLHGTANHWGTTGGTSPYNISKSGFRVYVKYSDNGLISPAKANEHLWHIHWIAVGK